MHRAIALSLCLLLSNAPVWAQLAVEPQALSVSVPQYETATHTVTLTNEGSEPLSFCLSFERPLQRAGGMARLASDAAGDGEPCGDYGEVLTLIDREDLPGCCADPYGLTMTPEGRLFAAEYNGGRTYELDAALGYVRMFAHPEVDDLEPFPVTTGVTYNADTGTLWWLNIEQEGFTFHRALLLEGDLDGVATGRQIELPVSETAPPPYEAGVAVGLVYDAARNHYYYVDFANDNVWAVDTLGAVAPGYPVTFEAYSDVALGFGLDAHSTGDPHSAGEGLRFEVGTNVPGLPGLRRIVTVGGLGGDTAPAPAEPLETPLPDPLEGTEDGGMSGEPVRSRLDPNGVLYYPYSGSQESGVVAVRPHPLPPSWLVVEAWDGALGAGESREIILTFRAGAREIGEYTSVLQAFEAESGEAVEVPLVLTVTQGTDAEGVAEPGGQARLAVYPNPSAARSTVEVSLDAASAVRVAVYDVLGRVVVVLHDGPLAAGEHALDFDAARLPAGVYLVRSEGGGFAAAQQVTVVR